MEIRKIIHVDMDAFYASVEQRDNPALRHRPVIVGGDPAGRGVVAAASYEARAFGVRSAMPAHRARALCPDAVFLRPRFEVYRRVSRVLHGIMREYTDCIEPVALDEAYLDVTINKKRYAHGSRVAREIKDRIYQFTGLTASAGVAPNKLLAKIASAYRKPDGLTVISPTRVNEFLSQLKLEQIPGIGQVTLSTLNRNGINSLDTLKACTREELIEMVGKRGGWFYDAARGIDNREVTSERLRKSLGVERTYSQNLTTVVEYERRLKKLSDILYQRLTQKQFEARTLVLKVKLNTFRSITRQTSAVGALHSPEAIFERVFPLMNSALDSPEPVRLLGLAVRNIAAGAESLQDAQLDLFPAAS